MLLQLHITNFAIIKQLRLSLNRGMNTLSGETGAGKSIIINAIHLIRGGRSSTDLIRTGCDSSTVEALFSLPENPHIADILSDLGIPFDGEVLIKRIIFREGRNRVFVNGTMATLQMLSQLAPLLISISGQHEHQLLLKPENHLYLLDDFGGLQTARERFQGLFRRYRSLNQRIQTQETALREQQQAQELAEFQLQEIQSADPTPGEDESLTEERMRLTHAEDLMRIASEGYQTLYEQDDSVMAAVSRSIRSLSRGAEMDPNLVSLRDALHDVEVRIEDIALNLRDFQKTIHIDPGRLEQVTERMEMLSRLKRKYGGRLDDVIQFKDELASKMETMDESQHLLETLKKEENLLSEAVIQEAEKLSKMRKGAAQTFEAAVKQELDQLHMKGTRFKVRFEAATRQHKNEKNGKPQLSTKTGWTRWNL
ncbi:MAG: AAA family ATPase [Deltaproteobacteria bacterium]|nr:AAA family ATPase [Deltaproteobacteria bacterium]